MPEYDTESEHDDGTFILEAGTNPESPNKPATESLKAIGISALIAVGVAVAQVAANFVEPVADVLVTVLPPWLGPLLTAGAAAAVAWLNQTARKKAKEGNVEALYTKPPIHSGNPMKDYY